MPHCRGGLTFLFRQESKQRTDQRRGAEEFPIGTLTLSFPVTSEINRTLLWTPLPACSCRSLVLVACRKLVHEQLVPTPTPVEKYDTRPPCHLSHFVHIYCQLFCCPSFVPDHISPRCGSRRFLLVCTISRLST